MKNTIGLVVIYKVRYIEENIIEKITRRTRKEFVVCDIYTNLYQILQETSITYFTVFRMMLEATKYYEHSTKI